MTWFKKSVKIGKKALSSWFVRIFAVVAMAVVLYYGLTMLAFAKLGSAAYADIRVDEMIKKTQYIAEVSSGYFETRMTRETYSYMLADGNDIWDATVFVYDRFGHLAMHTKNDTSASRSLANEYVNQVLNGVVVEDTEGIVIGYPIISSYGNVIGAVLMVKPMTDIMAATALVTKALQDSSLIAVGIMIIPVVLISIRLVTPIRKMKQAAEQMALGNYDITADETGDSEIASLGKTLNWLSRLLKRTIGSLKTQNDQLKSILYSISDGVLAFDEDGNVLLYNPAAEKMVNEKDNSDVREMFYRNLSQFQSSNKLSLEFDVERGEKLLHLVFNKVYDQNRRSTIVIVFIRDITEAARYEQSRREYVANVSHELRTPIATIKSLAEALNDGMIEPESLGKYYQYLYNESDRLARLINDLLELSRLQSGKTAMEKNVVSIYDTLMYVAETFSVTAAEKGISIVADVDETLPNVYTNTDRIEQVLVCLIDNAIKHSESDKILISAVDSDDKVIVSVTNAGEIAEADLYHIFERFYKADKSHSGNGAGLGLAISYEIMTLLGETLTVKSENGEVTFSFTLGK